MTNLDMIIDQVIDQFLIEKLDKRIKDAIDKSIAGGTRPKAILRRIWQRMGYKSLIYAAAEAYIQAKHPTPPKFPSPVSTTCPETVHYD